MTRSSFSPPTGGLWLLCGASLLGFIDAGFNYIWTGNGIHGSEGALLVAGSTLLLLIAGTLLLRDVLHGGLKALFEVLILLDLVGTAVAAYFLEAEILLALTVLAFVGFLLQGLGRSRRLPAGRAAA